MGEKPLVQMPNLNGRVSDKRLRELEPPAGGNSGASKVRGE